MNRGGGFPRLQLLPSQGGIRVAFPGVNESHNEDWFDTNFAVRKEFRVKTGMIPSQQNDFPQLISGVFPELMFLTASQIIFVGKNQLKLPREIQTYDPLTGELIAWVKDTFIDDGESIFLYANNIFANEQNSTDVWNADFKAVWHLDNDIFLDSTVNGNDGTNSLTTDVAGKIGDARRFVGVNDEIQVPDSSDIHIGTHDFTASIWVRFDAATSDPAFFSDKNWGSGTNLGWVIAELSSGSFKINVGSGTERLDTATITLDTTDFHLIHMVIDKDTDMKTYVDGVLDNTMVLPTSLKTTDITPTGLSLYLGQDGTGNYPQIFKGNIDEPRILDVILSSDWIETEFNNQDDPTGFYDTTSFETVTDVIGSITFDDGTETGNVLVVEV